MLNQHEIMLDREQFTIIFQREIKKDGCVVKVKSSIVKYKLRNT